MSVDDQSDQAAQIQSWWQQVEQSSLLHSLDFTHILHTDVTDCYGSLYTHSIAWALHGLKAAKKGRPIRSSWATKSTAIYRRAATARLTAFPKFRPHGFHR